MWVPYRKFFEVNGSKISYIKDYYIEPNKNNMINNRLLRQTQILNSANVSYFLNLHLSIPLLSRC